LTPTPAYGHPSPSKERGRTKLSPCQGGVRRSWEGVRLRRWLRPILITALILPLFTCTGFKGAFVDASGNAFKANATLYLQGACGAKITARAIDLDGDGIGDGIDLNGDGIADVRYIPIIANQLAGLDINGDGKSDYFMTVGLNDAVKITTEQSGGNAVTLTADAAGQVTGFNLTGDCNADNTIIADLRTDTTPPTSSADSSGGAFNAAQTVTLTCTDNFSCNGIAYTLDGSTPQFNGNGNVIVGAVGSVVVSDTSILHFQARDANGNLETSIHNLNFTIVGASVALPPAYTPATGYYSVAQNIALTSQTSGAAICYTTNTTTPTCAPSGVCNMGQTYSGTIAVTNVAIIRAVACKSGLATSPLVTLAYAIDGAAPANVNTFTATPGDAQVSLSWSNPADADLSGIRIVRKIGSYPANASDGIIIYTASGTSVTDAGLTNGTQYFYKAFAYDGVPNYASGVQATATPSAGATNQPTYSPVAATYGVAQNVTVSTTTPGALICYTTSGATPACSAAPTCTTGTTYSSAVNIASTATLKAIACKVGYTDSSIASGVYTIDTTPPANVTSLGATPANAQIKLNWTNPGDADFAGVKILRKTGSYPANQADGTVAYNSTGTSIADTGLTNGTQYFYTAFAYDTIGNYASGTQVTATPTAMTDAAAVAADKAALTIGYNGADNATSVTQNLTLASAGGNGTTITWASNKTAVISNAGVVTRPVFGMPDQSVTMTATITKNAASDTKAFVLTVKAQATCSTYTANGFTENCNGTVTDTANALTWMKCSQGQTYNSSTGACDGSASNLSYCSSNDNSCNGGVSTGNLTSGPAYASCNARNTVPAGGFAGITTWHVPTKTELKLIVYCSTGPSAPLADYANCNGGSASPKVRKEFFPNFAGSPNAWSSTSSTADTPGTEAWYLTNGGGIFDNSSKTNAFPVICVSN